RSRSDSSAHRVDRGDGASRPARRAALRGDVPLAGPALSRHHALPARGVCARRSGGSVERAWRRPRGASQHRPVHGRARGRVAALRSAWRGPPLLLRHGASRRPAVFGVRHQGVASRGGGTLGAERVPLLTGVPDGAVRGVDAAPRAAHLKETIPAALGVAVPVYDVATRPRASPSFVMVWRVLIPRMKFAISCRCVSLKLKRNGPGRGLLNSGPE